MRFLIPLLLFVSPLLADPTWQGTTSPQLDIPSNWNPNTVPTSTENAIFDASVSPTLSFTPQLPGASATILNVQSFEFTGTASSFDITITGSSSLIFSGTGIIGNLTNCTLNATNSDYMSAQNSYGSLAQIEFINYNGIPNSFGHATPILSNSGTLNPSDNSINDVAQLLFDGSGGQSGANIGSSTVNITDPAFCSITNSGTLLM